MMYRVAFAGLLACSSLAGAADKPLYQPAPAWVKPAPAIDVAALNDDSPLVLTFDHQDRLDGDATWSYADVATRLASPEVVAQAGTLSLVWNPAKGDLIVHRVAILRGRETIDVLAAGKRFEVIRREQQLEQRMLDGQLTATMAIEGLQVGDVLRVVASVTRKEPAFAGQTQTAQLVPQAPFRVGFARARVLWPATAAAHWRVYADGAAGTPGTVGGDREFTVQGALAKAPDLPDDAPLRYRVLPILEASTFADWSAVSRVMAPLYATTGAIKPGGALAGEVARIAAASTDPAQRAAAALQLVQEKVRYLLNGLGNGNYVPQAPEQTWALRYGDCKAKTLLLLAVLRALDVEAEPVLASSAMGDLLPNRLPGPGAFDHVLVRATIGGNSLWLDGTGSGTRYVDLNDTPPLRWVLPVRAAGAALLPVPLRAPAHPAMSAVFDLDQRAGIGLPTLVHAVVTLRGPGAEMVGLAKTQGSKEQKDQAVAQTVGALLGRELALSGYTLSYDPAAAVATIDARGLVTSLWRRQDNRYRLTLDRTIGALDFDPDRARPAWAAIPVATGAPDAQDVTLRVQLPAGVGGFTLDGDAALDTTLGGTRIRRTAAVAGDVITVTEHAERAGEEIAPADVAAAKTRVAQAKTRLLTAVAPDLPSRADWAREGRRDGRFRPIVAAYAAAIAADAAEVSGYDNRAAFHAGVFDWAAALPDYDKAIALAPTVDRYVARAAALHNLRQDAKALADLQAAHRLDPAADGVTASLAEYLAAHGRGPDALTLAQGAVDVGGTGRWRAMSLKASVLARAGQRDAAMQLMDGAIAGKPGDPTLLNARCWMKAQLNVQLDTALKDCTKSIELSDTSAAALDSRALVYYRLGRWDDAIADLEAALEQSPNQAASLYLRGIVRQRQGKAADAARDLDTATFMAPRVADDYAAYGIVP